MKKTISTIFLIITPIIAVFLGYQLNLEKPDVKYTLSENIPVSISGELSSESIQQLEVKNVGNDEAEEISVKINKEVISYEVIKNSEADSPEIYKSSKSFEFIYPLLPPEASFKLILNTLGDGIENSNLEIQHMEGKAIEALSKDSPDYSFFLSLILFFIYTIILILNLRNLKINGLERVSKYDSKKILKRKKPIYINNKKWEEIRTEAIEYLFKDLNTYSTKHIEDYLSYEYLTIEKPKYLSEEEWKLIIKKSSEKFKDHIMYKINRAYEGKELLAILNIDKPINFSGNKWQDLLDKINKEYLSLKKSKLYSSISNLEDELKKTKPSKISKDIWKSYRDFLKKEYFTELNINIFLKHKPYAYLEDKDLSHLDQSDIDKIKRRVYSLEYNKLPNIYKVYGAQEFVDSDKPNWIKDSDYKEAKEIANKVIKLDKLINENKTKNQLLKCAIFGKGFPENKPEEITEKEWKSLKMIYNDKIEINKLNKLKNKIEKQLNIINEFLTDPTVIDRIEEYNNVFAVGNFENLKKLSYKLRNNDVI